MADILAANLPVLTNKNWSRLSAQMKVLFRYQGVNAIVEEKGYELGQGGTEEQKDELRKKGDKALFIIHQCVENMPFEKIQNVATTREAWSILVCCHAGGEKIKRVKVQMLRKQYELLQTEDNDKISGYFNKILMLTNHMKGCGETITDLQIIEKIMRSLPQRFDFIVVAIEESENLEELQSSLEAHEMRLLDRDSNPIKHDKQALILEMC